MDSNKDIQKTEGVDTSTISKGFDGLFGHDKDMSAVYKKSERLMSATYLLTNLFPENDPLRSRLRELSVSLISFALSFSTGSMKGGSEGGSSLKRIVAEMISLLDAGRTAGMISFMNHSILRAEFEKFAESFADAERKTGPAGNQSIAFVESKADSRVASRVVADNPDVISAEKTRVGDDATGFGHRGVETRPALAETASAKGNETKKDPDSIPRVAYQGHYGIAIDKKDSRKAIILTLLKRKPFVTIKDVSNIITDCSEKTIQRELLGMVAEGVLKKEGERRWSRYALAKGDR